MGILKRLDKNMPILIVDDSNTMRKIVRDGLERIGLTNLTEAEDGSDALKKIREQNFMLILSDWNMPNMTGIDLLKAVRSDEKFKNIPFIMITSESSKDNIEEATMSGVSSYLLKPFTTEALYKKLEVVFQGLLQKSLWLI